MSDPTTAGRMPLPSLLSRAWTMWLSVAAAVVGGLGAMGYVAATDPTNRPFAVAGAVLIVVVVLLVILRRRWLDPADGAVVLMVAGWRRRWHWADASEIAIVPTQTGQVLLRLRDPARRTPFQHALVANDLGGERAQPPEVLRVLADEIERWSSQHTAVVRRLRSQADHLAAGGGVKDSPLMRR